MTRKKIEGPIINDQPEIQIIRDFLKERAGVGLKPLIKEAGLNYSLWSKMLKPNPSKRFTAKSKVHFYEKIVPAMEFYGYKFPVPWPAEK